MVLLTLGLLLPQVRLLFEREGWPDLVLLIDDSQSMSHPDDYQDPAVKAKADELARAAGLPAAQRLALAQALVTRGDAAWLDALIARQAKLHVFHCSGRIERLAELNSSADRDTGAAAVRTLRPTGPASALGTAVRTVLQEFRGSALAGVVMFTDGVTTEGDDLVQAAQQAAKAGVPLYFVGLGDAHEPRDLILSDLQVEDAVHVHDRLVFEARLTAKGGLQARSVPVTLSERQGDQLKQLAREDVTLDPAGKPVRVRLTHTPTSPGEREYVIEVPAQPDETDPANNRLTRRVYVAEFQKTRVLYVEGYPRYEYRFLKTLLERESAATRANKTIDLKVLLADADPDYAKEDRSAVEAFPPTREDLFNQYDLVILGDVDPRHPKLGEKHLQWLADFVREKGGGLLVIAGAQFTPHAYRDTPLADVLPVEVPANAAPDDRDRIDGYRLQLTPVGRMHPLFRFVPDEADNQAIWDRLAPLYWSAGPYKPKPAAEVLAVRPAAGATAAEPLAVQHFAGAGRAMYFGFDESWRWRLREDEGRYNQFWLQAVKYLARTRLGRVELRTDKQVPYRQGEPIRLTVRFPDDVPPPDAKVAVQVTAEFVAPNGEVEAQTLRLAKLEGSRATYEALLTRTSQGAYKFWLAAPTPPGAKPQAAATVLPPPGEMDRLQMNRPDLERAALVSRGRFYTLADAERLPEELPPLPRVTLNQPRPPWPLWNHPAVFGLAIALAGGEWLLRKRRQLL
ncbi:MAG TPA: VWA domain-containing protein [Gemmataceae bacterium]